jgi:hypothetical protein
MNNNIPIHMHLWLQRPQIGPIFRSADLLKKTGPIWGLKQAALKQGESWGKRRKANREY